MIGGLNPLDCLGSEESCATTPIHDAPSVDAMEATHVFRSTQVVLCAMVWASCQDANPLGVIESEINGGYYDNMPPAGRTPYDAVVEVSKADSICSGTIIGKSRGFDETGHNVFLCYVVTAAHCLRAYARETGGPVCANDPVVVYQGADLSAASLLEPIDYAQHPQFKSDAAPDEHDIALVAARCSQDTPVMMWDNGSGLNVGATVFTNDPVTIVGYGAEGLTGTTSIRKAATQIVVSPPRATYAAFSSKRSGAYPGGLCSGDSGGATIRSTVVCTPIVRPPYGAGGGGCQSREMLVGVAVAAEPPCDDATSLSYSVAVYPYRDWIKQVMAGMKADWQASLLGSSQKPLPEVHQRCGKLIAEDVKPGCPTAESRYCEAGLSCNTCNDNVGSIVPIDKPYCEGGHEVCLSCGNADVGTKRTLVTVATGGTPPIGCCNEESGVKTYDDSKVCVSCSKGFDKLVDFADRDKFTCDKCANETVKEAGTYGCCNGHAYDFVKLTGVQACCGNKTVYPVNDCFCSAGTLLPIPGHTCPAAFDDPNGDPEAAPPPDAGVEL